MKTSRLAAFLLGLAALAALPAFAQLFGAAVNLYPHGVASISNNPIVHASGNNVYVAFSDTTSVSDIYVRISTDNGTTFGPLVKVSNTNTHPNIEPVVVGDGTNVHVFWTDDVAGENPNGGNLNIGRIFYARGTQSGTGAGATVTFAAPVVLVSQPGYSRPTSALISGAQVHLVFYDDRAISGFSVAGRVFHTLSCNGGLNWTFENNVTQFDGDVDNEQPRISQLTTGEIFVSFRSSRGGLPQGGWPPFQVYLLRMVAGSCASTASGAANTTTWNYPAQRLSKGSDVELGGNYAANTFAGSAGGLHAAWWNDTAGTNLVYRYGKPNGAGFGAQQNLSGFGLNHLQWTRMTERTGFGIGEDATGQVHAIFQQNGATRGPEPFQVGSLWYNCSVTPGGAFVGKQLMGGALLASEPRAFYSNGRLHVVWMDFRNTTIEQAEIYYNYVNTATTCTTPPLALVSVASRKTHGASGAFDVTVDTAQLIGGTITVEPRQIGAGHSLVFFFSGAITATGTASMVDALAAPVGTATPALSGNNVVVTLTGVPDNQRVTVSLTNVNNAGVNASASMGFLVGDVNNSRSVTATDILQVKGRSGQVTDATNFRFDLNASGSITASDILAVKGRSGLVLP
jgi:hypothetical protein